MPWKEQPLLVGLFLFTLPALYVLSVARFYWCVLSKGQVESV